MYDKIQNADKTQNIIVDNYTNDQNCSSTPEIYGEAGTHLDLNGGTA